MTNTVDETTDRRKPTRRPLPEPVQQVLRDGRPEDANGAQWHVVLSARQHGWTVPQIDRLLADPANRAGWLHRQRRRHHGAIAARADLAKIVSKADRYAADHPPIGDRPEAVAAVAGIRNAADDRPWPGRQGTTDRTVLEALLTLAQRGGGPVFRASERQIAEEANASRRAVARSLERLTAAGWHHIGKCGEGEEGSTRRLSIGTNGNTPVPPPGERMTTGVFPFAEFARHDACSAGCLGASGARVLALVVGSEDALTAAEMADVLGVSAKTVRERLRQIASAGLAVAAGDRTWAPVSRDMRVLLERLDRLAWWTGKAGTQNARRKVHAEERGKYLERQRKAEDARFDRLRRATLKEIEGGRHAPNRDVAADHLRAADANTA